MQAYHALLLGVLQGLTEFLPISSSGHLALVEMFLRLPLRERDLTGFDILLHAGTAAALLLCYGGQWRRLIWSPFNGDEAHRRLLVLLVIATLPGAFAGLLFEDWLTEHTRSVMALAIGFGVSGLVLIAAHFTHGQRTVRSVLLWQALLTGVAQACALPASFSRSGLTASAGQFVGLTRTAALDFSFLMAFPIIVGASLKTFADVMAGTVLLPVLPVAVVGFLASFGASILAILFLRQFVARRSLAWFAVYLLPLSVFLLV